MSANLQLLFAGVANGCIYALIGLSFVLVYNAVGIINFAQSGLVTLGGYLAVMFVNTYELGFIPSIICCSLIMAVVGIVFERLVYRPLQQRGWLLIMISTIGVTMILQQVCRLIWSAQPLRMNSLFSVFSIDLGFVKVNPQYLLIIGTTIVLLIIQYLLFERTMVGKKLTATAQDREMARLMGINTGRMITLTFMYSMVLAAISGFLLVPLNYASTIMAVTPSLKAFVAAVIGGFGSIPGVIVGGVFIGIVETFGAKFISSGMKDAIAFIILIIFLIVRPTGFFGEKSSKRV
ncbi:MAG: branched-chain amino acid ABC transporter permease [Candidatus Heteroscillospira sp.]|jgi:branched-chain amino acid transport system permease protein